MFENPLSVIFGTVGIIYGLLVPIVLIQLLAFFIIASLLSPGAKARHVAQATYCYVMMSIGVLLMTVAALPTIASVLANMSYSVPTYAGLLILFGVGGGLFLWHEQWVNSIDQGSKIVPSLIYFYTVKIIGVTAVLLSALSIILTLLLGSPGIGWWVMPLTLFFYGLILAWITRTEHMPSPLFYSKPMALPKVPKIAPMPAVALAGKKPVAKLKKAPETKREEPKKKAARKKRMKKSKKK